MASLKLAEILQDLRKRALVFIRTPLLIGINLIKQQKRKASDYIGSIITRNWKNLWDCITTVDSVTFPHVLRIYHSSFDGNSDKLFKRYSKIFKHVFISQK